MSYLEEKIIENEFETKMSNITLNETLINDLKEKIEEWKKIITGKIKVNNTKEKGNILEEIITQILSGLEVFKIVRNARNGSNEIDLVVKLNTLGRVLRNKEYIPKWFPDRFLIECKNYNKSIDVTFVGKFISLLDITKSNLGLMVSFKGVSGRNNLGWINGSGLIKKFFLKNSANDSRIVLDINFESIEKLLEIKEFFEFIDEEKIKLECDIKNDFIKYIKDHPLKDELSSE